MRNPPNLIPPNVLLMPNMYGAKHEVKYSNGTCEIPMPEEKRDRQDENRYKSWVYRIQLSTSNLFIIAYRVSWLRANYTLTVHMPTLNPLYMVDHDRPSNFAKNHYHPFANIKSANLVLSINLPNLFPAKFSSYTVCTWLY